MALDNVIGNYILLLGVGDTVKAEMLTDLRLRPSYPSLQSVIDCFEEWNFQPVAAEASLGEIRMLQPYFIIQTNEGIALVISIKADSLLFFKHDGTFQTVYWNAFSSVISDKAVVFYARVTKASGIKRTAAPARSIGSKATLADLRDVAFGQDESPIYKLFRPGSVFISYGAIRIGLSANFITALWLLAIAGASLCISFGSTWPHRIIAILLILSYFVLDCADGEVARATQTSSRSGRNLERLFHWISDELLVVGATIGLYRSTGKASVLILGLACLAFHCVFNYIYIELESWTWEESGYMQLHRLSSILFHVMPLNLLLFLTACILGAFQIYLWTWLSLSAGLFILLALGYFVTKNSN